MLPIYHWNVGYVWKELNEKFSSYKPNDLTNNIRTEIDQTVGLLIETSYLFRRPCIIHIILCMIISKAFSN